MMCLAQRHLVRQDRRAAVGDPVDVVDAASGAGVMRQHVDVRGGAVADGQRVVERGQLRAHPIPTLGRSAVIRRQTALVRQHLIRAAVAVPVTDAAYGTSDVPTGRLTEDSAMRG